MFGSTAARQPKSLDPSEQQAYSAEDPRVTRIAFRADEIGDVQRSLRRAMVHENAEFPGQGRSGFRFTRGDPVASHLDLQFTPGRQVEPLAERLGHDKTAYVVDGNNHAATVV